MKFCICLAGLELIYFFVGGSPVVCGQEGASVTCRAYNAPSDSWNVLGSLPSASGPYYVFRTSPNNFAILGAYYVV